MFADSRNWPFAAVATGSLSYNIAQVALMFVRQTVARRKQWESTLERLLKGG
jgi:hypothetical protein